MSKTIFPLLCCMMLLGCAKPTDPESLTPGSGGYAVVAKLAVQGFAQDVGLNDTVVYVASGEAGLAIVSIADRTKPRLLSVCQQHVRGYSYKMARKDSIVYLAAGGFGINTVNVGDPYLPVFKGQFGNAASTYDVEVFGAWLFEAKGETGVRCADLSGVEPGSIDPRGKIENLGYAHGMSTTADSSLLLASGEMGLAVYDIRDISWYGGEPGGYYDDRKTSAAWVDLPGYSVDVETMGNQKIAFVACGTAGVYVVDFSDSGSARVIGSYATGGYAKELAYQNNRLYVTTELRGLQVLAVNNPSSPQLVGVVDTEFALGITVDQHYVYIADEVEGLIIVAIPPY